MKLNATIANLRLFNSGVYKDVTISFPTTTEKIHSAMRKIAIDGRENKRPVKRSQSDSCKVDPVQALIMALDLYERYEGSQH